MTQHSVVNRDEWTSARKSLLEKEKKFTRERDALAAARRQMPWVKVGKDYAFEGPHGKETLGDLFTGKSQLIVQHFMMGDGWDAGCPSCSFWADNYDGIDIHLAHRDIAFVTISNAPLEQIEAYHKRMGWSFKWVSSFGTDFNRDYHVAFTDEERENGPVYYNYKETTFPASEAQGASVFFRDENGDIFHTYSCYARGLDILNGAYHYMDLTPKGRNEQDLSFTMGWLRRHDEYQD